MTVLFECPSADSKKLVSFLEPISTSFLDYQCTVAGMASMTIICIDPNTQVPIAKEHLMLYAYIYEWIGSGRTTAPYIYVLALLGYGLARPCVSLLAGWCEFDNN